MSSQLSLGAVPANPLDKPGYRLEFHDEFEEADLDQTKWLASISKRIRDRLLSSISAAWRV
jgi:hypothetical protein